jgi:hypothetical protein
MMHDLTSKAHRTIDVVVLKCTVLYSILVGSQTDRIQGLDLGHKACIWLWWLSTAQSIKTIKTSSNIV